MSLISDQDIQKVREHADIVSIIGERLPLRRAGRNFKAACPFHAEKTPSFMVNPERQIFHCFGCGQGGDVFKFLMQHDGASFVEVVERLAERFGILISYEKKDAAELKRRRDWKEDAKKINRLAARFYFDALGKSPEAERAREYLQQRKIEPRMISEAFLGYAPAQGDSLVRYLEQQGVSLKIAETLGLVRQGERGYFDFFRDRLLFTILSAEGQVLGFSGRALRDDQQPKYLNSPDSPIYSKGESVLGLHLASKALRQTHQVLLVEGNVDWLRLVQEGIPQVVAPLGTALTEGQVRLLKRWCEEFVLLFDGDAAGLKAAERALTVFLPMGIIPKVVWMPQGEDPDTFVLRYGSDVLREKIRQAPYLLDAFLDRAIQGSPGLAGQAQAIERLSAWFSQLPGEVEKTLYIQKVADRMGISEALIWRHLEKNRGKGARLSNFSQPAADASQRPGPLPAIERALAEILFSQAVSPERLLREISAEDFSHPLLQDLWRRSMGYHQEHQRLDVAGLLQEIDSNEVKAVLLQVAVQEITWEGEEAVQDCLRQFRRVRMKSRLKDLSEAIHQAEGQKNLGLLHQLVDEQNSLMKKIRMVH